MMRQVFASACLFAALVGTRSWAEEPVVTPGDNLVTEGIPPIAESIADRAARYTEFRSAGLWSWHPKERSMLIGTRFADTPQVHKVSFPMGDREQLTFFKDRVMSASYHPHVGDYFLFGRDSGGNEFFQIHRYDLATGESTLLTDGKSRNTAARWSNAGDRIVYGSTRRTGADVDFWVMNPADPKATDKLLTENKGGGWGVGDWSPDDKTLLVGEYVSINESYLWLLDVATGKKTALTPRESEEKVAYQPVAFSKDGKGVYVLTDRDSEFMRLAYVDLTTKQHTYLVTDIPWDVELAALSHNGKQIALATNENGISKLHLFDTQTRKRTPVEGVPVGVLGGLEWHENNVDLGFVLASARATADVYSLNVESGKIDRWTKSETGGLNAEKFSEPELVTWKSFDEKEISGFLYRPNAEKFKGPRPVMVIIHGGPEGQSRPVFLGKNNYFIDELGIALLFPNVRGSSGYGKSFLQLDNGFLREDTYKDISALFDWIGTQQDLAADRIMVTGGSYGGHMTLALAVNYADRIRCALDVVGMSNLVTFLERTESYRRDLRRVEYGDERDPKMRAFLNKIAPLNHADKITKPLFVVQGANDPRVPLGESVQIVDTLKSKGTPVWYLMAKDEGHGFAEKKNSDFQFYATILFVEKFLLGDKS